MAEIRAKYGEAAAARYEQQRAAQAVPAGERQLGAPISAQSGGGALDPHTVSTAGGGAVEVAPEVVEASELRTSADAGFDPALQPRDRSRAASGGQVQDIAKNLNPERLGRSAEADRGAPIIGPDGMVESGNGRIQALRQAYKENGAQAQAYRDWLASQGADVKGMREPVLVRERTTPMTAEQRQKFAVDANRGATLTMSAPRWRMPS